MDDAKNPESLPEPSTPDALALRSRLPAHRWRRLVEKALRRAQVMKDVERKHRLSGLSRRASLRAIAPHIPWSTYCRWYRRLGGDEPGWERLLDRRMPPARSPVSAEIARTAVTIRRVNPTADCESARAILKAEFGPAGDICDTLLRRIWREAGLARQGLGHVSKDKPFNGGAGLALLCAASAETNAFGEMAAALLDAAANMVERHEPKQKKQEPADSRDERGKLTAAYNLHIRQGMMSTDADFRRHSDAAKREHKDLADLRVVDSRPEIIEAKLFAIGVIPLLTERRGFDGLDGPRGAWLELLGGHPYMPTTLDKFLSEVALLDAGSAIWDAHARHWLTTARQWSEGGPDWFRFLLYVDGTADPYWTYEYARSGKVCRVGRVMPCLSRVTITSGPGTPILMETHAGTVSLKTELMPALERLETIVGKEHIDGLTLVIDAEISSFNLLDVMKDRSFVTVLKGRQILFQPSSDWTLYRERDRVRDGRVVLTGSGENRGKKLELRAVEMQREDSSNPSSTVFVVGGPAAKVLCAEDVANVYLSRWPNQESVFKNLRNGGGLDHSHGYGGDWVTNVALGKNVEEAFRRENRAHDQLIDVEARRDEIKALVQQAASKPERQVLSEVLKDAEKVVKAKTKAFEHAEKETDRTALAPPIIYERDTTRENIVTALTLSVMTLIEFILKEYFGDLKMELRTFIEQFVALPVDVRRTPSKLIFRVHANTRNPERTEQMRHACAEVTRRKIRRNGRLLIFELVEPDDGS